MSHLWGVNDDWTGDGYAHPARERLSCLEIALLLGTVLAGWVLALWLDSVVREAEAIHPRPAVEGQK